MLYAKSFQSCPTLCDAMDHGLPGSSVHGILQARALEWVAMPPPGNRTDPGVKAASPRSPALAGVFFTTSFAREVQGSPYVYFRGCQCRLPLLEG